MGVENLASVDVVGIDLSGKVILTISDDLKWDDKNEHLLTLQNKINVYLNFIESEDIYQKYPNAKGRDIIINVMAKYEPNHTAMLFFDRVRETLRSAGYGFSFKVLHDE